MLYKSSEQHTGSGIGFKRFSPLASFPFYISGLIYTLSILGIWRVDNNLAAVSFYITFLAYITFFSLKESLNPTRYTSASRKLLIGLLFVAISIPILTRYTIHVPDQLLSLYFLLCCTVAIVSIPTFSNLARADSLVAVADETNRNHKILVACIFITIFIAGFLLRIYRLGAIGFSWDEIITGEYVSRILETGLPISPNSITYYWRGLAYHYPLAIWSSIFGVTSETILRMPSVLMGTGIGVLSYFVTYKISSSRTAALTVFAFISLSPFNFEFSRFARFYIQNAFLFMLLFVCVYEGFIRRNATFRLASVALASLMVFTVQLGMIAIVFPILIIGDEIISLLFGTGAARDLRQLVGKALYGAIFFCLLFAPSAISAFISTDSLPASLFFPNVAPTDWSYYQLPSWNLLSFFNSAHIPAILPLMSLIPALITYFAQKKSGKSIEMSWFSFAAFTLFFCISFYEIGSRGVTGSRIYLFIEPLVVILSIVTISLLFNKVGPPKFVQNSLLVILGLLLLLNIRPTVPAILSYEYGTDISSDPFRTADVASIISDEKSIYSYLRTNIRADDIWVSVMGNNYIYSRSVPDYVLNENYRWNANGFYSLDRRVVTDESGSQLIHTVDELQNIINSNSGSTIWITVSGSALTVRNTIFIRQDFRDFLRENNSNIAWQAADAEGLVLRLEPHSLSVDRPTQLP